MTMATARTSGLVRMITMREFRSTFQKLEEPVKVIRARGEVEIVGTWTPARRREKINGLADH